MALTKVRNRMVDFGGGIYLGGTGSANKLDDYEEGTWTPDLRNGSSSLTQSWAYLSGRYTKIGRLVNITFGGKLSSLSGTGTSELRIYGLPFVSANYGAYQEPSVNIVMGNQITAADSYQTYGFVRSNGTDIGTRSSLSGGDTVYLSNRIDGNTYLKINATYFI